ncbi:hypothetical protein [Luteolibacter sp. Populi]|uniref:hypothetical protein n=1 Tax=Luteolibacter sp. Populi TaxID=3230487 RepID=UPI0034654D8B
MPAILMWLGGLVVAGPAVAMLFTKEGARDRTDVLVIAGVALAGAVIGFAMTTAYGIFMNGNRHGMATPQIPKLVVIGSAGQLLASVGVGTFVVGSMETLQKAELWTVAIIFAVSIISIVASIFLHRLGLRLRAKWRFEHRISMNGREVVRRGV